LTEAGLHAARRRSVSLENAPGGYDSFDTFLATMSHDKRQK